MTKLCTTGALALITLATLAGCSNRMVYQTMQGWQQQECRKLPDAAERQRCMASTDASYDDYRRQRDAAKGTR
ncbi:MAG: hypothetical protein RL227_1907 [Pseudomonadota bacterium]|jgi:hypothetical protein